MSGCEHFFSKHCFCCPQVLKVFETPNTERKLLRPPDPPQTATFTHTLSYKSEYSKPCRSTICTSVIIFIWDDQRSVFKVISCAVGTILLSPEAVWQLAVCRCFTAHSSVAGVIHQIQTCFTAHSSVAGVIHQIQTCFTAHSSGAGVIHQIQTCFTAHRSGTRVIPQIQTCFTAHQCGRCQLACARVLTAVGQVSSIRFRHASLLTSEWQVSAGTCFTAHSSTADSGMLHCRLKTLLQMAPHSHWLFGFELLGVWRSLWAKSRRTPFLLCV